MGFHCDKFLMPFMSNDLCLPEIKEMNQSKLLVIPEGPAVKLPQLLPYIDTLTQFALVQVLRDDHYFPVVSYRDLLYKMSGKVNVLSLETSF